MNRDMNTRALKRSGLRPLGVLSLVMAAATTSAATALADEPVAPAAPTAPAASAPPALPVEEVKPAKDPTREASVEPKPAEPRLPGRVTLDSDPVADGAIIAVSFGAAGLLDLINSTGEIRPQQISPNFDRNNLLTIDRGALSQTVDSKASGYSSIGLFAAVAYAVIDPIASGLRESSLQTGLVDAIMYAETLSLTYALTNLTKMAIRRPRPQAYIDAEAHKGDPNYSNADTDSALSFISGHASITTAIGATATYLAFTRSPHSVRPWITLILATGLSTFVSVERVRAGAHFPTDVIAGCIAGAGIGVLVPHLHRTDDIKQRRVWVGFAPTDRGQGGTAQVSGLF